MAQVACECARKGGRAAVVRGTLTHGDERGHISNCDGTVPLIELATRRNRVSCAALASSVGREPLSAGCAQYVEFSEEPELCRQGPGDGVRGSGSQFQFVLASRRFPTFRVPSAVRLASVGVRVPTRLFDRRSRLVTSPAKGRSFRPRAEGCTGRPITNRCCLSTRRRRSWRTAPRGSPRTSVT